MMTPKDPEEFDDDLTSRLAAEDDSFARGKVLTELTAAYPAGGLEDDLAFLHMLRQTLRRPEAGADAPGAPADALPGTRLGRFTIRRELGRGGFGIVYLAHDALLGRDVALKVPRAEVLVNSEWRARFRREAQAAAGLDHPGIVPVFEVGEVGPVCFLVSAYCPGPSLAEWLKQRAEPVPFADAAALLATLAEAVQHAHARGVVHRDLKPANILLVSGGVVSGEWSGDTQSTTHHAPLTTHHSPLTAHHPKITDFGLAKMMDAVPGETSVDGPTRSGAILGTTQYMAPEQAEGKAGTVGPAADIYALGVVLYELLTGQVPFRGETDLEVLLKARAQDPVSPARLRRRLPRDLETICLKCLQKEPARRYASAGALAEDLRRFLAGQPILARPVGTLERVARWSRRNPLAATLTGSVAALLVLAACGSLVAAAYYQRERDRAVGAEEETRKELAWSLLAQARAGHQSSQTGRHFLSLEKLDEAVERRAAAARPERYPSLLQLRDVAINCLARADLHLARRLVPPPEVVKTSFDARLERYVTLDEQGTIRLLRVADEQELTRVAGTPVARHYTVPFRLSPDGRFLAVVLDDWRLELWDLARGERLPHDLKHVHAKALDFRPDGRALAVGHKDGTISLYDLEARRTSQRLPAAGRGPAERLVFAPDGARLATYAPVHSSAPFLQVRDAATGDVLTELAHPTAVTGACWSSDGRRLAAGGENTHIYVWDVAAARVTSVLKGHGSTVVYLALNPAGDLLASTSWDSTLRLWDLRSGELLFTTRAGPGDGALDFSPDGLRLGSLLNLTHFCLWQVSAGWEHSPFEMRPKAEPLTVEAGGVSPDGRLLAAGLGSGRGVRIWDVESRRELADLPTGRMYWAAFAPRGLDLYTSGDRGLYRWPVRDLPGEPSALRIGPPERVLAGRTGHFCFDKEGRSLAVMTGNGATLLRLDDGGLVRGPKLEHHNASHVALSPDGCWAATATWNGHGIKVWDVRTGRSERTLLPTTRVGYVFFSPDGHRLLTSTEEGYQFWRTDTWEPGSRPAREDLTQMPGGAAFSAAAGLLAVEASPGRIRLHALAGGDDLATLDDPELTRIHWMTFSPDGSRLVVKGGAARLRVWDLRRLRDGLARRGKDRLAGGLDWDLPPFPPPAAAPHPINAVQVELTPELYAERAQQHARRKEWPRAVADYEEALRRDPNQASAANNLAWLYVTGPWEYRDAAKALPLAQRGTLLHPRQFTLNTLGVVYYRLGQWQDAVITLRAAGRADGQGLSAWDLYFLAMSHHRLGDTNQAKECFQRAGVLHKQTQRAEESAELDAFRAEAEIILEWVDRGTDASKGDHR